MKTGLIFGMIAILASVSFIQVSLAFETEQEPEPPQIPQPSPAPEPIRMPDPAPAPDPFPEESDSEKVKRLTQQNDNLKQENSNRVIMELANQLKEIIYEKIFAPTIQL